MIPRALRGPVKRWSKRARQVCARRLWAFDTADLLTVLDGAKAEGVQQAGQRRHHAGDGRQPERAPALAPAALVQELRERFLASSCLGFLLEILKRLVPIRNLQLLKRKVPRRPK